MSLVALALAGLILAIARYRARGRVATRDAQPGSPTDRAVLAGFLTELGGAMIDSGDPVTHVQDALREVAHANEVSAAGIVVLPTAMLVSLPGADAPQTSISVAGTSPMRLDQIDEVFVLADDAAAGRVPAAEALSSLHRIRESRDPYSPAARVLGHSVLTTGLAAILDGSMADVVVAAVLGLLVGIAHVLVERHRFAYEVFVPVAAAFTVALVVLLLPRTGVGVGVVAPLVAPLVTFLPGALLTTAVIELATGQIVSGSSRLAAGVMQLTLLALGILVAAQLVGVPGVAEGGGALPLGEFAPWIAVAVFGAGVAVFRSARRRAVGWILLVLYVAYAGQVLGGFLLGNSLSGFVGALLMTPVAVVVSRLPWGPSPLVSFLPAFWLLVPGALGLVGLTQVLGRGAAVGAETLLAVAAAMIGIAFGVLLGLALANGVARTRRAAPIPSASQP